MTVPRRTRTELISQRKVRSPFAEKRQGDVPADEKQARIAEQNHRTLNAFARWGW